MRIVTTKKIPDQSNSIGRGAMREVVFDEGKGL